MKQNDIGTPLQIFLKSVVALLIVASTQMVGGQTLQTVCAFSGTNGARPQAGLTLGNDGNFYGTTAYGGSGGYGTVFRLTTNGTLTSLVSFAGTNGAYPEAALTLGNDGNLYGTTWKGGMTNSSWPDGMGTIFRVKTDGTLTSLCSFAGTNGALPLAPLTLGNDGNFYGTAATGLGSINGTVFKVSANGTLTTLVSFFTYAEPRAGLTLGNDGNFYGSTWLGGTINATYPDGLGTIFKITPDGTLTTLLAFNNTNGVNPQAALTPGSDGDFYGATPEGGSNPYGTVFKVTANGTLTTLVSFSGLDGAYPQAGLALGNNGNLYGTTVGYGSSGYGTLFKVTTNGTLTTLASFFSTNASPLATLTMGNDGNFYGTTDSGGITNSTYPYGMGTVFSFPSPDISIQPQRGTLVAGSDVTYYVTLGSFGTPPFVFQWLFNGSPIAGATNTSLTISNFGLPEAGLYSVTVSNAYDHDTAFRILRLTDSPIVLVDGIDVGGGSVSRIGSAQISMSSTFGSGAPIYYTLDGSTPDFLSTPYQGPFQLARSATIRALAYDSAYVSSAEAAPVTLGVTPIYPLTVSTPGGGGLSLSPAPYSGGNLFVSNTLVSLTAVSSNGWSFLGWLGDASGPNPVVALQINRPMAAEAFFGTPLGSNVLGAGQIQFSAQLPAYPFGATVGITAIPETGNYLINWAGALSGSNNPNVLTVTNPQPTVTALFGPLSPGQYALSVLPQGEGLVRINPYTNRYASGTLVTLTAVPAPGQNFSGWSGDASGAQNPLTLTMTQSQVIGASFTRRPTLSVAGPQNGMVEQGFRFALSGELGAASRIYGSSNFLSWLPLAWVTNDFGTAQFLDPGALTNALQFYRAVTP
jgi:uncharacterized repeat protein (TIGR03803 family)